MKLVIATGIYPPEIGGPSYYAKELAEALTRTGHDITVCTFSAFRRYPSGIRHITYFWHVVRAARDARAIIALDTFSVGFPGFVASILTGVPIIIRTGGDFLWESFVNRTNEPIGLSEFYATDHEFTFKERLIWSITRLVVRRATMVFSTAYQRDLWIDAYRIEKPTHIIANAIESQLPSYPPTRKNFLWYVRDVGVKNGPRVKEAFALAQKVHPDIELDTGHVTKEELLKRMAACYAVILPSLSEISPNYIFDGLRFKKPFIVTAECGQAELLEPYGTLVDPTNVNRMADVFCMLATDEGYEEAKAKAEHFASIRTYDAVAEDFLQLL
ncbi:hypothetical protein EBR66_00565 [bacterium]|nr:hypothetical protein [bacterium]